MKLQKKALVGIGLLGALGTSILVAVANDYPGLAGGPSRVGRHTGNAQAVTPGRMFVRWADPTAETSVLVDNWDFTIAGPKAHTSLTGTWSIPTDASAAGYVDRSLTNDIYRYAPATVCRIDRVDENPANNAQTFSWNFPQFQANEDVALFVNIPVGQTDTDPLPGVANETLVAQARYQVYRIEGVVNPDGTTNPVIEKIDTFQVLGGKVRLGGGGAADSTQVYRVATNGALRITLVNTIPRDQTSGSAVDPDGVLVYADEAEVQPLSTFGAGTIAAQPVVGRMTNPADPFPFRVVSARNEPITVQSGSNINSFNLASINTFAHHGYKIDAAEAGLGGTVRRNLLWSWPARRPYAETQVEIDRYITEKRDWILENNRAVQSITVDNQGFGFTSTGGWIPNAISPGFKGIDFLETPSVTGVASEQATFAPRLAPGDYTVDVWSPGGGLADDVSVQIFAGAILVDTVEVDFSGAAGWRRITSTVGTGIYTSTELGRLRVVVRNLSSSAAGLTVPADMVRFNRSANLAVTSTPYFVRAQVNDGGVLVNRDVVIVAMENGRIYCMDADAPIAGGKPKVYWAYPSELPTATADPNQVVGLDGPDGIAEMPSGFDTTSAYVRRVTVSPGVDRDLLYIGSRNGKIFCIDMEGRGDQAATVYGTTTRRWSWPNDYPSAVGIEDFGKMEGSIAWTNAGGTEKVIVPAANGKVFALDAVGDNIAKTTTLAWQFPLGAPAAGDAIAMTPAVEFGRVYYGNALGEFRALNAATGAVDWTLTAGGAGAFGAFGISGPATVPAAVVGGGMPDTVYFANGTFVYAADANTGAIQWNSDAHQASATQSLGFTYRTNFTTTQNIDAPAPPGRPVVVVPSTGGAYKYLFARTADANSLGNRSVGGYFLNGAVTPVAFGGLQATNPVPADSRLDEEHGYMYGADSAGNLVAWSYDPDLPDDQQYLPPGRVPGRPDQEVDDPTRVSLDGVVAAGRAVFVLEEDFNTIRRAMNSNTFDQTLLTDVLTRSSAITRQRFEFGERMSLLVYNMPDPSTFPTPTNYSIEFQVNTPGGTTTRRSEQSRVVQGAPAASNRAAITQFALVGSGNNAVAPGAGAISMRAIAFYNNTTTGQQQVNTPFPNSAFLMPGRERFTMNHPMGIRAGQNLVPQGIGIDPSIAAPFVDQNGNSGGPAQIQALAPDVRQSLSLPVEDISHGQTGQGRVILYDRSCMRLLLGVDRGLPNVRVAARDLNIVGATGTIPAKPLVTPLYNGFEQPIARPNGVNVSLDYPDISRDKLRMVKQVAGDAQNPLFLPITLAPAFFTLANYDLYKTDPAVYNTGLTRTLSETPLDIDLDTPQFQPPSVYSSQQYVYIDPNQGTRTFSPASGLAYRQFELNGSVGFDERLEVGEEIVDLNAVAAGAGFAPVAPWANAGFRLDLGSINPAGDSFFNRFSVRNTGNVNLLNVRVAKSVQNDPTGNQMGAANLHPLAWMDTRFNLHSDLDPVLVQEAFNRPGVGIANRNVILQKARPGDLEPTRLRVNPSRRPNGAIGSIGGPLADPVVIPQADPKIAVSAPLGSPMGSYSYPVTVFEDVDNSGGSNTPQLSFLTNGSYEPDAPTFILRYNVDQTQITNKRPKKGSPMVDDAGVTGAERYLWANQQPTIARDSNGHVMVAFTSNRIDNGGLPAWAGRPKLEGDTAGQNQYRLYIASLGGSRPLNTADPLYSPLSDLNRFAPATGSRWFVQEASAPVLNNPGTWNATFGLGAGESVEAGSLRLGAATFPSSGVFAGEVVPTAGGGRNQTFNPYIVFVAEFNRVDARGDVTRENRLMIAQVTGTAGALTLSNPVALTGTTGSIDPTARIGKPTLVQNSIGLATVMFPITSAGQTQLGFASFNGTNWVPVAQGGGYVQMLTLSHAFETVTSPALFARYEYGTPGGRPGTVLDFSFVGRVKGRQNTEVFFGRMNYNRAIGYPTRGPTGFTKIWQTKTEQLQRDDANGVYSVSGVEWDNIDSLMLTDSPAGNIDPSLSNAVDLFSFRNGQYTSILYPGTRKWDSVTRNLTAQTKLGGTVTINTSSGSIRFDGAIIPQTSQIFVRYAPRFIRVSGGKGANYRQLSMAFDDRLTGDVFNWFTSSGAPLGGQAGNVDRFLFSYIKGETQGAGVAGQAMLRSLRFGVPISRRLRTDNNGNYTLTVSGATQPYQVDPVRGRVYFSIRDENASVIIRGVDTSGNNFQDRFTVGLIDETPEFATPVKTGVTTLSMCLDAQNTDFNSLTTRRPGLVWLTWTGAYDGTPEVFFGTVAPDFSARR